MWQVYSLGSLLAGAFETVTDKAGMVRDSVIDSYVASFYRAFFFLLATICVGLSGLLGPIDVFFHWSYVIVALLATIATLMYTYLIRTVELTVIGATSYLTAFLFLFIDAYIVGTSFTVMQILGIVLLVLGGLGFSLDGKTHHFRKDIPWKAWCAIAFIYVFSTAIEAYLFKYLHTTFDVNAVSYYVWTTLPGVVLLLGMVIYKGRGAKLVGRPAFVYMPYAALGKAFDALNSILYVTALAFASVAQVSAFNALTPLMLVMLAWVVQGLFGFRLREHLDYHHLSWKIGAAFVLVLGGILVA